MESLKFAFLCMCVVVTVIPASSYWSKSKSYIELDTPNLYHYINLEELGIEVGSRQSFRFQVRAYSNAHVALLESAGDTKQNVYELVIGGWSNSRSVIRNSLQGAHKDEFSHAPLDGSEYHDFWISWKDGVISVGIGLEVGTEVFLAWKDPEPHQVNYISVTTGFGTSGWWRFGENMKGPTLGIATENNWVYRSVLELKLKSFSFSVMAANDAHIALLRNKGDIHNSMYEIVIGGWGNTQSVIRKAKQGATLAHAHHHPLSANQHIPFWISVKGGTISIGHGSVVGRRRFMFWTDLTPTNIRFVSVATGWGATGHWLFLTDPLDGKRQSLDESLLQNSDDTRCSRKGVRIQSPEGLCQMTPAVIGKKFGRKGN